MKTPKNIVSGITPSGNLTIAHFFYAIKPCLKIKDDVNLFFLIADLHALTTTIKLNSNVLLILKYLIAAGFNKDQIFVQSQVNGLGTLTFIFGCFVSHGRLKLMTQFKDKSQSANENNFALLNYPLLMASDILLYDADVIVGHDQKQHIELTRDLAVKFNKLNNNKDIFHLPTIFNEDKIINQYRIRDLKKPKVKMSKSTSNGNGVLFLADSEEEIKAKILRATTDSENKIKFDFADKPGISNLILLFALSTDKKIDEAEKQLREKCNDYLQLKTLVAEAIISNLKPLNEKLNALENNSKKSEIIKEYLTNGQKKAQAQIDQKLGNLKKLLGLNYPLD